MRQVVLDTETTGLQTEQGHRVIEIGAVEIVNRRITRRHFHKYINPQREIDAGAQEVHGISLAELQDKPLFAEVAQEFLSFVEGAEVIIHNAPFDVTFIDYELSLLGGRRQRMTDVCNVVDSLAMARNMHPGQRNSLDALCRRYGVDNSARTLHGALLDAEILADVYLLMTGGQTALFASASTGGESSQSDSDFEPLPTDRQRLPVLSATQDELSAHEAFLALIDSESGGETRWRQLEL